MICKIYIRAILQKLSFKLLVLTGLKLVIVIVRQRLDEAESVWRCWWVAGGSMRGTTELERDHPPKRRGDSNQLPGFAEKKKPADIKQEDVTSSSERQPKHLEDLSDSEATLLGRGWGSLW